MFYLRIRISHHGSSILSILNWMHSRRYIIYLQHAMTLVNMYSVSFKHTLGMKCIFGHVLLLVGGIRILKTSLASRSLSYYKQALWLCDFVTSYLFNITTQKIVLSMLITDLQCNFLKIEASHRL